MPLTLICKYCSASFVGYGPRKFCSRKCFFNNRDATPIDRFWKQVDKGPSCWQWKGHLGAHRYGCLYINGKPIKAHRFSFELHCGKIPEGKFVCHRCDNPGCVNPDHLYAGTQQDNMLDAIAKGRMKPVKTRKGSSSNLHKLTESSVLQIRSMAQSGLKQKEIAALMGVTPSNISYILNGKIWAHV